MLMAKNGDVKVVNAGDRRDGRYKCSVRSRMHLGIRYDVIISAWKGWTCKCAMYDKRRKICAS